jgi:hypothetical protein
MLIFSTNCRSDIPPETKTVISGIEKPVFKPSEIDTVNFYFENSLSMNGYLKGENFRNSMAEIIYSLDNESANSYFVNTKAYQTTEILEKIRTFKIEVGDTGNSDHKFIFTNAIKNAAGNNLSIVVTDGIYSMSSGGLTLGDVEKDIEKAFENALKQNELETVVLKMASSFTGRYYSESCPIKGGIKIDHERPYYILLFGNKEVIDKALEEIVVDNRLDGFKEQARFFITNQIKVDYSILLNGKDKKGSFKPSDRKNKIIKSIDLEERYEPRNSDISKAYLQFAVGVNFTNLSIPKDYLLDTENYTISDNTDYEVLEIKDLNSIDALSLNDLKSRDKDFSHLIIMKGKSKLYGNMNLQLDIKMPNWIEATGSNNDCEIINDKTTTFSFHRLMFGITKAYEKINKKKEYFNLTIKIKPE